MKRLTAFLSILSKDMRAYYLKPPNISWGILFPLVWTGMFFVRSGHSGEDLIGVLPGMVAISILFGTTSMLAVTVTFERKAKAFERLLLAPIPLELLMLAKTGGAILFGVVNALVPFCIAFFLVDLSGVEWAIVFPAVVMIAVVSAFLGLFIAVSVSEVFEAQTFSNFFRFPMIFLCGLFFPVTSLPHYLQPFSWMLPLTYGADLLQGAIAGKNMLSFPIDFLAIVLFALLLFFLSLMSVHRKWIY
ncbi:MAG: ABC transporter permease [Prosthecochloris sp.]|uniref:Transport permease protein n=1 Tax=Prosthecochloris aestuarii (strain DSM 271 / SK 413) TaxID=290512 RepID=B4S480_PROA2|nr:MULTISPECIES: ABC transporter permease [Prosthecochloris]ACF45328.1 ABC-2 type transporter [Prosthecochloris aestuarii DSM 271]MCW8797797.1 ABC transporter permease [Prosthecochloris sp.]NEX12981.1 ABC transporter permease [Prosthecochloris sp.]RDD31026.1 ABC transporter permease [Prosthecochloris sp. ZM]